ncbi:MAG TPA: thioredoxin domain-containing protein, partial [bacterium]|nr:thioredoxin domain-containing protein [bacterium]
FPKHSRYGRPGIIDLLQRIAILWRDNRGDLLQDAENLAGQFQQIGRYDASSTAADTLSSEIVHRAYVRLAGMYDETNGGFGAAPKFPSPHQLIFLLRYRNRTGEDRALAMVEETLAAMRRGGIFDHIGYGFHRYSTDRQWLVPHFEKMLYDQAMLTLAYVEAYQATGNAFYAQVIQEILTYVDREMTSPDGGFYSAEDADSEGVEGRFYLWDPEEVKTVLGDDDGELFCRVFNIRDGGNFRDEATGEMNNKNIPHLSSAPGVFPGASTSDMTPDAFRYRMETLRTRLFQHRAQRIHPLKDDKILTDWNGLMIAAMAGAGRVLACDAYIDAAARAADFVLKHLRNGDGRLLKRYRDGQAALPAHLDDYAFMIWGLLELYEAGFQSRYLREAKTLTDQVLASFADRESGGFYLTADDGETLLFRDKPAYDGAIPSGNSVMAMNLLRLHQMLDVPLYLSNARLLFKVMTGQVERGPSAFCQLLQAGLFEVLPPETVVIAGIPGRRDTLEMVAAMRDGYHPDRVVLFRPDGDEPENALPEIAELAPFTANQRMVNGKATAYICREFTCRAPVTDP